MPAGRWKLIICSGLYQAVWFAGVLSATRPAFLWLPPVMFIAMASVHWVAWPALRRRALVVIATALAAGLLLDSLMERAGVMTLSRAWMPLPFTPIWLLSLWAGFGLYIAIGLDFMHGRFPLAAVAGLLGGPLAYRAGVPFGAVSLPDSEWASLGILGCAWAGVFAFLIWLAGRIPENTKACRESSRGRCRRRNLHSAAAVTAWAFSCMAPMMADAIEVDFAGFPEKLELHHVTLERRGVGRLRRYLINGCDIALYSPAGESLDRILDGSPKALSFLYFTRITGEQFARTAEQVLRRNLDERTFRRHAEAITRIGNAYENVQAGDRYLLYHVPGRGLTLAFNGKTRIRIEDEKLADAYFRIWLGENPIDRRLFEGMTRHVSIRREKEGR